VERDQLWQKVTALLAEKAKKDQELQELQRELFKLKAMTEGACRGMMVLALR